jgi:hypothetical protein
MAQGEEDGERRERKGVDLGGGREERGLLPFQYLPLPILLPLGHYAMQATQAIPHEIPQRTQTLEIQGSSTRGSR